MKKRKLAFLGCVLVLVVCCKTLKADTENPESGQIRIYSFNIQIFGAAKMAKPEVVEILADIVSRTDMTAVQEVRSANIGPVTEFMVRLPERYAYVLGPREGRSSSKEQYWIIYDTTKFTVLAQDTFPDEKDIFERNPLAVYFKTSGSFDFILINNHIQPSAAEKEIRALPEVIDYYRKLWNDPDVLSVGDFNADGIYFDESQLSGIFPESEFKIIITNEFDTTVAESDNTYDRFIITNSALEDYAGNRGVLKFDDMYDFTKYTIIPKQVSDHYPIWADFYIDRDTD
jgi:endonuclease/exonuclease/phosphatase family metal-dependent hydrolase